MNCEHAEWGGKDTHDNIRKLQDIEVGMRYLQNHFLPIKLVDEMEPRLLRIRMFPVMDMNAFWSWHGKGGLHDKEKKFCHYCDITLDERADLFSMAVLSSDPMQPGVSFQSIQQACEYYGISVALLREVNNGFNKTDARYSTVVLMYEVFHPPDSHCYLCVTYMFKCYDMPLFHCPGLSEAEMTSYWV